MRTSLQSPVLLPCKPLTLQPLLLDQTKSFKKYDINDFKDINNSETFGKMGHKMKTMYFFKLLKNELSIPEVSECIRIDKDLHMKLFYKGSPLPLPQWF